VFTNVPGGTYDVLANGEDIENGFYVAEFSAETVSPGATVTMTVQDNA
jgi:hypothetical protein